MKINALTNCCNDLVNEYAKQIEALDVQLFENKNLTAWSIILNMLKIEFVYCKKETLNSPVSTLYCRIYLEKNSNICYTIPDIISYLDIKDFQCYYFSYIENEKRMKACFDRLTNFIDTNLDSIVQLSTDADTYNNKKINQLLKIVGATEDDIPKDTNEKELYISRLIDFTSGYLLTRYTKFIAYNNFINGNHEKALKQYERASAKNPLTEYEKKLVEFIKGLDEPFNPPPDECASSFEVKEYNGSKNDFLTFLISIPLCIFALSIPFAGAILICNIMYQSSTLFCDNLSVWNALLFGGLPAVFAAILFKEKFDIIFRKDKQKAKDFDDILIPKGTKNFAKFMFIVVLMACIALFFLMARPSIKLYDDYLLYTDDVGLELKYEKYELNDLDSVYHVDGRYNDYGDFIDRDSYILCFKDGKQIDTDTLLSSKKDIENNLLPILNEYVDCVQNIKSENDIT